MFSNKLDYLIEKEINYILPFTTSATEVIQLANEKLSYYEKEEEDEEDNETFHSLFVRQPVDIDAIHYEYKKVMAQLKAVKSRTDAIKGHGKVSDTYVKATTTINRSDDMVTNSLLVVNYENIDTRLLINKPAFSHVGFEEALEEEKEEKKQIVTTTIKNNTNIKKEQPIANIINNDNNEEEEEEQELTTTRKEVGGNLEKKNQQEILTNENNKPTKDGNWAVIDDSSIENFYVDVPQMALQFPFELDAFQKRAVRHLERGESVF